MTEPTPGERWVSQDKRDGGKTVRVLSVDSAFVYVEGFRQSRVRRENFARLYRRVSDV
jgi:hypothetical protein